ncbi:hypothetical protein DEJ33_04735 [Curtobacterium sp. MCPF17_047]|uniref:hypothetical protein n=2 Tax=Curtobacterium TaxID=2034 RepID=UPI000DA80FD5|nr:MULTISPECIES: hypothetical protein [unclassified Curtobacterium]PZE60397.1 hypothetical protein DEJ24_06675 [Curtobacterium sp. MCPF17_001]PZF13485.1 hypothetical protein DEJ25_06930 [Curtobacterium sp. MCPF17_011]PZF67772.1 hypothetical protein DEJ33_04735 [Curtobacterium sp. MCPF17_047]
MTTSMPNDHGGDGGNTELGEAMQHEAATTGDTAGGSTHVEERADDDRSGLDLEDRGDQEQSALAALGNDARGGDALVGGGDDLGDTSAGTQTDDQAAPGGSRERGADTD